MKARLLERQVDAFGPLEVVEQGGEIALHFGNQTAQSAWRPDAPDRLCFAYYRALTLPLALHPAPDRIGLFGLGGGVMAKFLLEHTESSIHAVDLRPALAPLAQRHFGLDIEDPRLDLQFADLRDPAWQPPEGLDVALIDLFDEAGMTRLPDEAVARLADAVAPEGLLAVNLWRSSMPAVVEIHRQLSRHFHPDALVAHIPDRLNTVMIYRPGPWRAEDLEAGLKRLTAAPGPLRRAQGQAWQWLQPLRGQRRRG
jgi:spermidine synthase